MPRGHRLAAPREQEQQRPAAQPVAEIGDRVQRGLVGGVDVIEHDDARLRPLARRPDDRGHALQQTHLGARAVQRQRIGQVVRELGELGHEERRIRQALRRHGTRPTAGIGGPHGFAQQLDDRAIRKAGLVVVAPGGKHHRPAAPRARNELLGQPGLPDAGLALDHGQAAIRLGAGVGVDEHGQLLGAPHQRQVGRHSRAGAASRGRGAASASGGAGRVPSFTCS